MSTKIGDMAVYISANTGGLAGDLKNASSMVASFASGVGRQMAAAAQSVALAPARMMAGLARSAASFARDVTVVAGGNILSDGIRSAASGLAGMVQDSVKLAAEAEVSAQKFEVLLGNAGKAKELLTDLRAFAAVSPLSMKDATEHATRLLGAKESKEQIVPTLSRLSDLAMGNPEDMKALVRVYTQIKGLGVLHGQDWNQVANLGTLNRSDLVPVMRAKESDPAKAARIDEAAVFKLQEQGRISFHDFQMAIKATTDEGGRFFKMGEKYAGTFAGKVDKLSDSWQELKRYVGEALIEELSLKDAADGAGAWLDSLKPLVDVIRPLIRFVGELARGLAQLAAEGGKGFVLIGEHLLGALGKAFPETAKGIRDLIDSAKNFKMDGEGLANFAVGLGEGLINAIKWAKPYWDSFVDDFVTPITDLLMSLPRFFERMANSWKLANTIIVKGPEEAALASLAKAQSDAEDEKAKRNMKAYGLSLPNALELGHWQDRAAKGLADQQKSSAAIAQRKNWIDDPALPKETVAIYKDLLAKDQRALADATAMRLDAEGQQNIIFARGSPDVRTKSVEERFAEVGRQMAAARTGGNGAWKWFTGGNQGFKPPKPDLEPRLVELANDIGKRFEDPAKKFQDDFSDLRTLFGKGKIDHREFALSAADLMSKAAGHAGVGPPQLAGGVEMGSQQLASMVAQAGAGTGPTTMEGLLKALADFAERQLREAEKQTGILAAKPPVANMGE